MATLLISQGVPMILGGDEMPPDPARQQQRLVPGQRDQLGRLVDGPGPTPNSTASSTPADRPAEASSRPRGAGASFLRGSSDSPPDIAWHGFEPCKPDWSPASRSIALTLDGRRCDRPGVVDRDLYIAFHAHWLPHDFRIPASPSGRPWRLAVDTALPPPGDVSDADAGRVIPVGFAYPAEARSLIILVSEA